MDKATEKIVNEFGMWLKKELLGCSTNGDATFFAIVAKNYLKTLGIDSEATEVNYSKRSQLKRENANYESKRDAELREGSNWLGRGIGARGDWDI